LYKEKNKLSGNSFSPLFLGENGSGKFQELGIDLILYSLAA
jgi:hypothetical protein